MCDPMPSKQPLDCKQPRDLLLSLPPVWFCAHFAACDVSPPACPTPATDVHAGNLLVLPDGRVGFIDFGIVGRIR